ncbi:MAG TPA: magnesium/cobalt transporter CorA [Armatimonadota bacterium]|jgi:magnesium transporter
MASLAAPPDAIIDVEVTVIHIDELHPDRGLTTPEYVPGRPLDRQAGALYWVDAEEPSDDELRWIGEQFNVHPLALEDYSAGDRRTHIERYPGLYSIIFYALKLVDEPCRMEARALTAFAGDGFLVTLHRDPFPEIQEARDLWHRNQPELNDGVGVLLYSLLDVLVDDYFPLIDLLAEKVEEAEDQVMEEGRGASLDRIFSLKRQLLYLRRILAPSRDVMNVLLRREIPIVTEQTAFYFQDVYDHLVRIVDSLDTHRDLLAGALDLYVSVSSKQLAETANQLNLTMQVLAAWSIILMSGALIAGIYGMNFQHMPELSWLYGYPFALGLMVTIGGLLIAYFRHHKWL